MLNTMKYVPGQWKPNSFYPVFTRAAPFVCVYILNTHGYWLGKKRKEPKKKKNEYKLLFLFLGITIHSRFIDRARRDVTTCVMCIFLRAILI